MPQVIINDILPRTQSVATHLQTLFSAGWTANYASDIVVYQRGLSVPADDDEQLLAPSAYTVAFIGAGNSVQITLVSGATTGDVITIVRNTPADRLNLYTNANFLPSMLNQDFGILTLVDQQNQLVNQEIAPRYNYSAIIEPIVDTILPILGPGQIWMKDEGNDAIVAVDFGSGATGGGNISSWETITDPSVNVAGGNGIVAFRAATPVQVVLPAIFNVGDEIGLLGSGAGGWSLVANAGQTIKFGSYSTSVAGAINSDVQYANIFVRGLIANTTWTVELVNTNPTYL